MKTVSQVVKSLLLLKKNAHSGLFNDQIKVEVLLGCCNWSFVEFILSCEIVAFKNNEKCSVGVM